MSNTANTPREIAPLSEPMTSVSLGKVRISSVRRSHDFARVRQCVQQSIDENRTGKHVIDGITIEIPGTDASPEINFRTRLMRYEQRHSAILELQQWDADCKGKDSEAWEIPAVVESRKLAQTVSSASAGLDEPLSIKYRGNQILVLPTDSPDIVYKAIANARPSKRRESISR